MRAIISVSNKTGVADFAEELSRLGFEVFSTGGTKKALAEAQVPVKSVSEITGFLRFWTAGLRPCTRWFTVAFWPSVASPATWQS